MNKKLALFLTAAILALSAALSVHAVPIEGQTPEGAIQAVGVSDESQLYVTGSTFPGGGFPVTFPNMTAVHTAHCTCGAVASACYPAAVNRGQGVLFNNDPTLTIFLGGPGVLITDGIAITAGSSFSPDSPTSFIGALFCVSSGPTTTGALSYFYATP